MEVSGGRIPPLRFREKVIGMTKDINNVIEEKLYKQDRIPRKFIEALHRGISKLAEEDIAIESGEFIDVYRNGRRVTGMWMWLDPATADVYDFYAASALINDEGNQGYYAYLGVLDYDHKLSDALKNLVSGKWHLRYDISSALVDADEPGTGFIRVYAWCPNLGEDRFNGHCIITNASGSGRWIEQADGTYHQTEGTLQFHLPKSASGIKRLLRAEYLEILRDKVTSN